MATVVLEGETAAVRLRVSGTHRGDFFGAPPTGRSFSVKQINIERFRNGCICEHWRVTDELGLAHQPGLLPEQQRTCE